MPNKQIVRSGAVLEVYQQGVLIMADSGVGKTDLALQLMDKGHVFVTDDAVVLRRCQSLLIGSAPEALKGRVAIRGLGILHVQNYFNTQRIKPQSEIKLLIELQRWEKHQWQDLNQQHCLRSKQKLLGLEIVKYTLPFQAGRPLALLVELLVKHFIQARVPIKKTALWT